MRKTTIVAILFAVAGLAFASNDVWKTKPYQQWDSNDVKEVLTNSPWVKKTSVMASWARGGLGTPQGGQRAQNQDQAAQRAGGMNGTSGGAGGMDTRTADQNSQVPQEAEATFFVRWSSAQTIREAVARNALLNSQFSQAQVEEYVNQVPKAYALLVYGKDMTPFAGESEDTLKSTVYLEVKPSKEKISPSEVKITKDSGGDRIISVEFLFPRQGANGQPLIAANDKQAQFNCKLKLAHIDAQFDLRKMAGKSGEEL